MIIKGLPGVQSKQELKKYILKHGPYSEEENLRIYEKWFANSPRYLFRAVDRKYSITEKTLCDIGCSYGMNLIYCEPGSYGLEIDPHEVEFAKSLGLRVINRNIMNDTRPELEKVEVIWCSAVLEHVDSPHLFLRRLYQLLKKDGLIVIYVPTPSIIPQLQHLPKIGRYFSGYKANDHINAFVPHTLRFTCERAGFQTLEVSPFYPGIIRHLESIPFAKRLVDGCVYVGKKIETWAYPSKSSRLINPEDAGH